MNMIQIGGKNILPFQSKPYHYILLQYNFGGGGGGKWKYLILV
jgi:hypothetical protein